MKVSDIMTKDPVCCEPSQSIRVCARLMRDNDCGEIPVVENLENRRIVGVVTDRDITCRAVAEGWNPSDTQVRQCFSSPAVTVLPETPIEECSKILRENQLRRLPVVDRDGKCCGIVAQADIALRTSSQETGDVVKDVSRNPGTNQYSTTHIL